MVPISYSNPCLRVAYIDEVEERESGKVKKVYYSVLVKAVDNLDQVSISLSFLSFFFSFSFFFFVPQTNAKLIHLLVCTDGLFFFCFCEGNLPHKIARNSKIRRREAGEPEPCSYF